MSAADQSQAQDSALPAALQARLDYLFRQHVRDDPAHAATGMLRRYMENYRAAAAQTGSQP